MVAKFVGSVISAIMLLITPMFPLSAPFKARLETLSARVPNAWYCQSYLKTSPQKVLDNAKQYMERQRPNKPVRTTGFRPI